MNTESNESRIWGPPGCGKTTYLAKQIGNAVAKYGKDNVLVTSFTKAAATELVGRALPVTQGLVGTLHSHCYRALGGPPIAETKISDWNKENGKFKLSQNGSDVDEFEPDAATGTPADEIYARLQILRAKMTPVTEWPTPIRKFSAAWEQWKGDRGLMDFTDMIETARTDLKIPPHHPNVLFVDEAQDLTRMQLCVLQQWGRHVEHIVIAADDDQTIFTFAGASPEVLLETSGSEYHRTVLSQSYRVPRAVHALSQAWISKVSRRESKEYKPRDADGEVRLFHKGNYKQPQAVVEDAERHVESGRSVMFLASCSYMLEPLKHVLRDRGLPFHNPYRRKRRDWNPLGPVSKSISPADRLLAFLKPHEAAQDRPWSGEEMQRWTKWLRANAGLLAGAEHKIKHLAPGGHVSLEVLRQLLKPDFVAALLSGMMGPVGDYVRLWTNRLEVKKRKTADYPVKVLMRGGIPALEARPKIIIGTGHSVKGGEADVVYIFPDLSSSGMRQWLGRREEKDAVIRLGYVMMTRAKETLVICDPVTASCMPMAEFAARLDPKRVRLT